MKFRHIICGCLMICWACQEIEDAAPMARTTFARFYERALSMEGVVAEPAGDGFIMLANSVSDADTTGYVIRTDARGGIVWETPLPGTILRALVVGSDGYFVLSDSIKVNPESEQVSDLIIYSAILYKVDLNGAPMLKYTITDQSADNKTDFKASALTLNSEQEVILLGTFQGPVASATERPFLAAFNPATLDTLWTKAYNVIDRDYVNARSVHATADGHIVWASAILKEQQSFERSYLSVPYIQEESVFENNDVYGATTDQRLLAGDIRPAYSPEFGYGIVGTYASPAGENSNIFFARVTRQGNFIAGSERFFDGELSAVNLGTSGSQDTGDAICATQDGGFVLAGTMVTTPGRGHGGKDIFMVKVDAAGNMLWNNVMGGSGDEEVNSIRETADGGLLLCGSKDAGGLPATFLIKTDKDGKTIN